MASVEMKLRSTEPRSLGRPLVVPQILLPNQTRYAQRGKRVFDVTLSVLGLIVLAPLLVTLAVLVRLNLGKGGILFRQERVGRDGVPFQIYKFRSMLPDRRKQDRPFVGVDRRLRHKSPDDPRHTPFGRFIRANSLDELPQLLNVLKGDMSLVGPRPELTHVAVNERFLVHPRHIARPGVTGTFQISSLRAKNSIASGLHLDVGYVADVRLRRDLAILVKTVLVLVSGTTFDQS